MAAEVKITANTRDAQQKIQKLRHEVDQLDRQVKKPKKVNIITNGVSGGSGAFGRIGGGMRNLGSMVKAGAKGIGLAASTAVGTFIGSAIGEVVSALMAFSPAILRASTGLSGVGMRLKKFMTVLEAYGHPEEEALNRANNIDALDDERRNHNTATLSQEAGYRQAWEEVAGVNAPMMLDKVHEVIGQARSGVFSEMQEGWGILDKFGITNEDLNSSVWEVMAKMLKAYNDAGLDGKNELQPVMQKLFGNRYMGVVRKMGDGTEFLTKAKTLSDILASNGFDDPENLKLAGEVEELQGKARMYDMMFNKGAFDFARAGAQNTLATAEEKYATLGGTAHEVYKRLKGEVMDDMNGALAEVANSEAPGAGMLKDYLGLDNQTNIEDVVDSAEELSDTLLDATKGYLDEAKELIRTAPRIPTQPEEVNVPGWELSRENLGDGKVLITSFDYEKLLQHAAGALVPSVPSLELFKNGNIPPIPEKKEEPQQQKQEQQNDKTLIQSIDKLTTAINSNTNSSIMLNTSITNANNAVARGDNGSNYSAWV